MFKNTSGLTSTLLFTLLVAFLLVGALSRGLHGAAVLDDQVADSTGLSLDKRGSHPNMNNLLFGRRSLLAGMTPEEAQYICKAVHTSCAKYHQWVGEQLWNDILKQDS